MLARKVLALACLALGIAIAARAQTIPNPSFEADTFTVFPGYVSDNGLITGWTDNADARVGINQSTGPFADNGTIPDGSQAGFIQSDGAVPGGVTLNTIIDGLTVGQSYKVNFRVNARNGQQPNLKVEIDGTRIIDTAVSSVGGSAPYKYFAFDFTAASDSQVLTLRNDVAGDTTVVVDDFSIAPLDSGWSFTAWSNDADSGVDSTRHFTHAYNFGSSGTATINGIPFIGVPGGNPGVAGQFSTYNLANVFNGDGNLVTGGSQQLASDFVYGNTDIGFQSITILGLTVGHEYVATIYSVGWETGTRAATFSVGEDRLTVNQDHFTDNNGIRVSYRYVATKSFITLNYRGLQNATFHTYGFSNFDTADTPPTITQQPKDLCLPAGQDATFTVSAAGIPDLTYQWRKNGVNIDGETSSTLTIGAVSASDMAAYSVVIENPVGPTTSKDAFLEVGIASIVNPSFEVDTFTIFPGYKTQNGPITGWDSENGHGINPGSSFSPFADNGAIPDGNQVAFMQDNGALSQTITGFTPGSDYYVVYFENARSGGVPSIEVKISGTTIVPAHPRAPVGGGNDYIRMRSDVFTADAESLQLSFIKSNPQGGDTTALIDNVCIVELAAGTPPRIVLQPTRQIVYAGEPASFTVSAIGSLPFTYQWRKGGVDNGATDRTFTINSAVKGDEGLYSVVVGSPYGSDTSTDAQLSVFEAIPDLYNSGVDNLRAVLPDGQNDPHYALTINADGAPISAVVQDSTLFPIVAGPWMANTATSKWIGPRRDTAGAAGGRYVYRTTIDLTDRDPSTVVIIGRWSVDNGGFDIMVNGELTGNPSNYGFDYFTTFTLSSANATFVAGINNIDFITDNAGAGWTGLRVEIDHSNVKIPAGIAPSITLQPISQKAVEGDTVIFRVAATGSDPLAYQWKKNGVDLPGQTTPTLTLVGVVQADSGNYSVSVGNVVNSVNSDVVSLCVSFSRLPGLIFGTGVDELGAPAANGSTDLHYILAASADGAFQGPDAIVANDVGFPIGTGPWLASGPNSKWIAPQADQGTGNAEGDYTFQTFFDLTGYDATQLRLAGNWAVDNTGIDILINGVSTGITSPGFGSFTPFTISTGLIAGPNTLDFKIHNLPASPNPMGLRVDIEVQVAIQPTMTITPSVGGLTLSWSPISPCQKLQSAQDVTGPWTTIDGATSPYPITTGAPAAKFFKIIEQ